MGYRVAIIGCGGVTPMHCDGYRSHPDRVSMVAVCDVDRVKAEGLARTYDIPGVFTSLDEALSADWDIGVVCTPTSVRAPLVAALAAAGKHVFVEKPLADNYEEALQMVLACEEAGVKLAVDQNFRFHYPFDHARALIRDGRIGPITQILHQDLHFRQDGGWRTHQTRHALSVMGIHWFDGLRWVLDSHPHSLVSETRRSAAIDCEGETDATVQITFENGVTATYVQSFSSPIARTETLILGEHGALALNYQGIALYDRAHGGGPLERWDNPYGGANKPESAFACLSGLLDALDSGGEPTNGGRDNLVTVGMLDAAYRSAAAQAPVLFRDGVPQ